MDFGFNEEQEEAGALAQRILEDKVTEPVLRAAEAADLRFDAPTWSALAEAGLLGIGLPTEHGGGGLGLLEQCVVLEQVGRTVAPVPVAATTVFGGAPVARFGGPAQQARWLPGVADGSAILTATLSEPGNRHAGQPVTTATEADSTAASSSAACGATSRSNRAVGAAGVASTTASASIDSGSRVEPTVSRKPFSVRASARPVAPVRTITPGVAASASVSRYMPPSMPAKTGPSTRVIAAPCSTSEPRRAIASSCGTAARADSSRAWPA